MTSSSDGLMVVSIGMVGFSIRQTDYPAPPQLHTSDSRQPPFSVDVDKLNPHRLDLKFGLVAFQKDLLHLRSNRLTTAGGPLDSNQTVPTT
jgi:hypothetical protein